jgi:lactase-phlorizin hydrolase
MFTSYGDRVTKWITFNEAYVFCQEGYGDGVHSPGITIPATEPYKCMHNTLKSHALAYRLYESQFKGIQGGVVGISIDAAWYEPKDPNNPADVEAAKRASEFGHGWAGFPVVFGDYPPTMRQYIGRKSEQEGREESRLPVFTDEWKELLKGSADFLGLNHYTTELVAAENRTDIGLYGDQDNRKSFDPDWPESAADWLRVVPFGFRRMLNWIKNTYGNPVVYVTENGFSDEDSAGLSDDRRIDYYNSYINNMLKAVVKDGCNVKAYTAWSLMDNFEWARGYTQRYGSHYVGFNSLNRTRTPKKSVGALARIFADNGFPTPPIKNI